MSSEVTIDAVRLALGMQELQARVASVNIANANRGGARALRVDFSSLRNALIEVARGDRQTPSSGIAKGVSALAAAQPMATGSAINADEEVGTMVVAGAQYQALGEALSRQFGLMRLAISGRS